MYRLFLTSKIFTGMIGNSRYQIPKQNCRPKISHYIYIYIYIKVYYTYINIFIYHGMERNSKVLSQIVKVVHVCCISQQNGICQNGGFLKQAHPQLSSMSKSYLPGHKAFITWGTPMTMEIPICVTCLSKLAIVWGPHIRYFHQYPRIIPVLSL